MAARLAQADLIQCAVQLGLLLLLAAASPSLALASSEYAEPDAQAWMPGMGRYGEISSASNCTDYQARRLG